MVGQLGGIFKYFQTGVTYISAPISSVILFGLFWKRANYAGAKFGLIFGSLVAVAVWILDVEQILQTALGLQCDDRRDSHHRGNRRRVAHAPRRRMSRNGNRSSGVGAG